MILIFGGAYNGKKEFARSKFGLKEEDIFLCKDEVLRFDKKAICGLHIFTKKCVLNDIDSVKVIKDNIELLKDKIIICDEIGSGIVPMTKEDRMWREENGRVLQYLCKNADEVYRVFFGLSEKLISN